MASKNQKNILGLAVALIGFLFSGSSHADVTNTSFVDRVKKVQEDMGAKPTQPNSTQSNVIGDAWANTNCNGVWYNSWSNGSGGWGNSTCNGSWSNSWSNT